MLPKSGIDLSKGIVFQDQPSLTWTADPVTKRLRGHGDGWEAVRQAVEIIVNVERYKWQIYTPNFGTDYDGLLGNEPGFVASELKRRLEDAFLPDSRLLGMKDFTWSFQDASLAVSFTVLTVFGDVASSLEVELT